MYNCYKHTCKYLYNYNKLSERAIDMCHEPQEVSMIQKGVSIGSKIDTNKEMSYNSDIEDTRHTSFD